MAWFRRTIHLYLSHAITIIIIETIKTQVAGKLCMIGQNSLAFGSQGQYSLSEILPENGTVNAKARSAAARSNINKFRGVRT